MEAAAMRGVNVLERASGAFVQVPERLPASFGKFSM
jgi:hypothetical protein